jgi:hypothetical protein
VAELVDHHEHADGDQERQDGDEGAAHRFRLEARGTRRATISRCERARLHIGSINVIQALEGLDVALSEDRLDHFRDAGEREAPIQEGLDRDFVCRIQHGGRGAAAADRLGGEAHAREAHRVDALELELAEGGEVERRDTRPRCAPGQASAQAIGGAHVGLRRAARSPSRRGTRPSSGSRSAGGTTTSIFSRGAPKSQWASITSRPLFIIVAESTEILGPITQLGWAHGLLRRRRPRGARPAWCRNGPPEAVSSTRRTPGALELARAAAGEAARQRLEDRRVLAVDRQQAPARPRPSRP